MIDAVEETVLLNTTRAGVAVVTLNRPKVHNAFNPDVINRLKDIFKTLRGADGVRAVLIDGAGPSFSAGAEPTNSSGTLRVTFLPFSIT